MRCDNCGKSIGVRRSLRLSTNPYQMWRCQACEDDLPRRIEQMLRKLA